MSPLLKQMQDEMALRGLASCPAKPLRTRAIHVVSQTIRQAANSDGRTW